MISPSIRKIINIVVGCVSWITCFINVIKVCISHFPLELLSNLFIRIKLHNISICLSKIIYRRSILNINVECLGCTLFYHVAARQFDWDNAVRGIYYWIKLESRVLFKEPYPMRERLCIENYSCCVSYFLHLLFRIVSVTTLEIYWDTSWYCFKFQFWFQSDHWLKIFNFFNILRRNNSFLINQNPYSVRCFKSTKVSIGSGIKFLSIPKESLVLIYATLVSVVPELPVISCNSDIKIV